MATDCTRPRTTRSGSGRGQRGSARSDKKENIALFMRCAQDEPNIALFMVLSSVAERGEGSFGDAAPSAQCLDQDAD